MNTDEKFNYYAKLMAVKHGKQAAKALETAMSQMLEMHCTESIVWSYAKRQIEADHEECEGEANLEEESL